MKTKLTAAALSKGFKVRVCGSETSFEGGEIAFAFIEEETSDKAVFIDIWLGSWYFRNKIGGNIITEDNLTEWLDWAVGQMKPK